MFKSLSFWLGLLLFICTSLTIAIPNLFSDLDKIQQAVVIGVLILLYIANDIFKNKEINDKARKKIVEAILARADVLKYLNVNQRLRANIFAKTGKGYELIYQFNMTPDNDKDIVIPNNMGVTGEVFRTGNQEIAERANLHAGYRTPLDIINKAPADLEWICSTPIKDRKNRVLYTLSIDGNINCTNNFSEITRFATDLAMDLKFPLGVNN